MSQTASVSPDDVKRAADQLDAHVREIVNWHFSPETGTPFWLEWAKKYGILILIALFGLFFVRGLIQNLGAAMNPPRVMASKPISVVPCARRARRPERTSPSLRVVLGSRNLRRGKRSLSAWLGQLLSGDAAWGHVGP